MYMKDNIKIDLKELLGLCENVHDPLLRCHKTLVRYKHVTVLFIFPSLLACPLLRLSLVGDPRIGVLRLWGSSSMRLVEWGWYLRINTQVETSV